MKSSVGIFIVFYVVSHIQCENLSQNLLIQPKTAMSNFVVPETANDVALRKVLTAIANRKFQDDDTNLLELMKERISEAVAVIKENNPQATLLAANHKTQDLISNVTASYTQAIFKSKSPAEAKQTLQRFQKVIKRIVDFTKSRLFLQH